ncbi:MAG TPA: hypothetical protein VFE20_03670 [Thermoleophilia bacterium]|nr:hypothetical protein [Thermoleophilia bacterium]
MLWIFISLGVLAVLFRASWGVPLLLGILGWIVISTVVSFYLARLAIERDGGGHNEERGD